MKKLSKALALLLALLLVMSLTVTAFAADNGTITVNNATIGKYYDIYKVFDATYSEADNTKVVYTYDGADPEFLAALQGTDSPFSLTQNTIGSYNVSLKADKDASAVSTFLMAQKENLVKAKDTVTADSQNVVWNGLDYGYYYITSTLGGTVTINSAAPNAVVQDKNQSPSRVDPDGEGEGTSYFKQIVNAEGNYIGQASSADYGDTTYWVITANATNYDGADQIIRYTVTDTLGAGYKDFSVTKVMVGNEELTENTRYTKSTSDTTTIVTIPWVNDAGESLYAANTVIKVYCQATVGDSGENYTNSGKIEWVVQKPDGDDEGTDPDEETKDQNPDEVTTYTYDITIDKYAVNTTNPDNKTDKLANAKFVLYKKVTEKVEGADTEVKYYYTNSNGDVNWVKEKDSADVFTTANGENDTVKGQASIVGLAAGTYYLEETEAPAGYNLLTAPQEVVITDTDATAQIGNNTGTVLPSTGGIGTTMFYVIGGIMVLAAVVLLVTKRRMRDVA